MRRSSAATSIRTESPHVGVRVVEASDGLGDQIDDVVFRDALDEGAHRGLGRALALGLAAGAASYLVGGLHDLAGWLDPFRFLSPFWLVGQSPLQGGTDRVGVLVVLAAAIVALALGAVLVERRDLEVP